MYTLNAIPLLFLCLNYIICCGATNSCTTLRQNATCVCELSHKIEGCTDVAIGNVNWTGTNSINCDSESRTDPKFVMRCFRNRFGPEGAGSSVYIIIVITIVLCLCSSGAFLWQRKTSNKIIKELKARIAQQNDGNRSQYEKLNMDNQN